MLEKTFDFSGILLTIALVVALGYSIYCSFKKKDYPWQKPIFVALFILGILDFIILIFASIIYFIFEEFPEWIPSQAIKLSLLFAILITFEFVKKKYKDIIS